MASGQLVYRGVTLGPATKLYYTDLEGLAGMASVRGELRPRLRQHGAVASDDYLDARYVSFTVHVLADSLAEVDALCAQVQRVFSPLPEGAAAEPMVFSVPGVAGGGVRRVYARPRHRGGVITARWVAGQTPAIPVELVCPDPRIYDETEQQATAGLAASSPGLAWPLAWPLTWGGISESGVISAVNEGDMPAPWRAVITGPVTHPAIEHLGTGQRLALTITLTAGQTLELDSDARTVLLDGVTSRYSALTTAEWFDLDPGVTSLRFTGSTTGTPTLTLTWRSTWS